MIRISTRQIIGRLQLRTAARAYGKAVRCKAQDQLYIIPDNDEAIISFTQRPTTPVGKIVNFSASDSDASTVKIQNKDFVPNPDFLPLLHQLIYDKVHQDFAYQTEAGPAPSSHLPIFDFRGTPPYGRTPDVDDVIGYVRVDEHGEIVPHSYEENPMYRLLNDTDGLIRLSDFIHEELLKKLA